MNRGYKTWGGRLKERAKLAHQRKDIRDQADRLFKLGERLRFSLLRFGGDPMTSIQQVEESLKVFAVFEDKEWMLRPSIGLLDATATGAVARRGQRAAFPVGRGTRTGTDSAPRPSNAGLWNLRGGPEFRRSRGPVACHAGSLPGAPCR